MGQSNKNCDKEFSQLDRLKHENRKLKRQISALRKQLERIDVSRWDNLQELVQKQAEEDKIVEKSKKNNRLKQKWACFQCDDGVLRLIILNRRDGVFYYRSCSACNNRTKPQKYHKLVDGIKDF